MESSTKDLSGFFTKIGVFWALGPFISYKREWKALLCSLSKKTYEFWHKHQLLLDNLEFMVFADEYEMIKILKEWFKDDDPDIFKNLSLALNYLSDPKGVKAFLEKSWKLRLKTLKRLAITAACNMGEGEIENLAKFMDFTLPSRLEVLSVNSDIDIEKIESSFSSLLRKVHNSITFRVVEFSEDNLRTVLENWTKVKSLNFIDCSFRKISDGFSIGGFEGYQITSMNWRDSWQFKYARYPRIDKNKLSNLLKAMSYTNLILTLNTFYVSKRVDADEVQDVFDDHGFNTKVVMKNSR